MRDRERSLQRPADTLRVAVVGASEVEAYQVPLEQTFEAVLERELAPDFERQGKRVDVLNFGVAGYSLAQQYLTLQNHIWKYDPQVVVLIFDDYLILKDTLKTDPPSPRGRPDSLLHRAGRTAGARRSDTLSQIAEILRPASNCEEKPNC